MPAASNPVDEYPRLLPLRIAEYLLQTSFFVDEAIIHVKIRFARSSAKSISCVTITIVMPSLARRRMTTSTSLTMVGSSAEAGSSNRITSGSIARQRAIATRCFWPPESSDGNWRTFSPNRTTRSRSAARSGEDSHPVRNGVDCPRGLRWCP